MTVERLIEKDEATLGEINSLLHQLSEHANDCTLALLEAVITDRNVELWVVREGKRIVGMGELVLIFSPEGIKARIEDVVVDSGQRGRGVGSAIMSKLIERAKERNASSLELSSRPSRVAANALYSKLGMTQAQTNVYRLKF